MSNYLIDRGHEVTIIDNLSTGSKNNIPKNVKFFKIDISDTEKINKILFKNKYDVVFHFAAFINNENQFKIQKNILKIIF